MPTPNRGGNHFLEDLRSDPQQLWHPWCFAEGHGAEELIAAVHREDLRAIERLRQA